MKKLRVLWQQAPNTSISVGKLAEVDRKVYFEYEPDFIASGIQLSPLRLPLQNGLIEHRDRGFGPLPGLFDDSLPDGWGLLRRSARSSSRIVLREYSFQSKSFFA